MSNPLENLKQISELNPYDLNCNIFSVYDYDSLSIQELLCKFFEKINDCIDIANATFKLAEWLVTVGLKQEVAITLEKWLADGTLKEIINETIFSELNEKIELNKNGIIELENKNIEINNKIIDIKSNIPYKNFPNTNPIGFGNFNHYNEGSNMFTKKTYGTFENACVASFITGEDYPRTQVLGGDTEKLVSYTNRDSVALYSHNKFNKSPYIELSGFEFTENSLKVPLSVNIDYIKEGMVIDVNNKYDSKKYVGIVGIVNKEDRILSMVEGFKTKDSESNIINETPPNYSLVTINNITKVWGINNNIFVTEGCPAGCGLELGVFCNHSQINDVGGIDVVNFESATHYGFKARGVTKGFNNGFISEKSGVHFSGEKGNPNGVLLRSINEDGTSFEILNNGQLSKMKGVMQTTATSTTIGGNISSVLVSGENVTLKLPKGDRGKLIKIITLRIGTKIQGDPGVTITFGKQSGQEVALNIENEYRINSVSLICDGTSWYECK